MGEDWDVNWPILWGEGWVNHMYLLWYQKPKYW